MNVELLAETNARKVTELDAAIDKLTHRITTIQEDIYKDEETKRIIQGGGKMSFTEKWQENQRKSKEHKRLKQESSGIALI